MDQEHHPMIDFDVDQFFSTINTLPLPNVPVNQDTYTTHQNTTVNLLLPDMTKKDCQPTQSTTAKRRQSKKPRPAKIKKSDPMWNPHNQNVDFDHDEFLAAFDMKPNTSTASHRHNTWETIQMPTFNLLLGDVDNSMSQVFETSATKFKPPQRKPRKKKSQPDCRGVKAKNPYFNDLRSS